MSSVMAAGGVGKLRQNRSTNAAVMRATSMREGAFSSRLMVGCEHSARPLSGARPTASLNRGSVRRASQSSASFPGSGFAGPRTGSPAGDREHAEAQHRRQRVDHQSPGRAESRMQPASASARPSRRSASRKRTTPPSDEISPPPKSAVTFLRLTAGRSNGSRSIFGHGGVALSLAGKKDASTTNFYPITTTYATSATTTSDPARIMRASESPGAPIDRGEAPGGSCGISSVAVAGSCVTSILLGTAALALERVSKQDLVVSS